MLVLVSSLGSRVAAGVGRIIHIKIKDKADVLEISIYLHLRVN